MTNLRLMLMRWEVEFTAFLLEFINKIFFQRTLALVIDHKVALAVTCMVAVVLVSLSSRKS